MNNFSIFFWAVFLLLLQIFVLNNINFFSSINPYLYVAIIFIFPLYKNRFIILIFSFLYGLALDSFTDTGGIHAFSLLFVAYLRLFFIKLYFKKSNIDFLLFNIHSEPFGQVFNYVTTLTIIHHFLLIFLDNFSFQNIDIVLLNTLYSSTFTLLLYFLGSYLFKKKQLN
ncbi:MAG: Uncharacterised protein [Flavobacterium sp. SCGC AAA160-P02]|nr:MAG: Uncharacterised protein [Flavobacterium sp. SCGC AAA160-P02]|tara:strand:- start:219 stop:725 length:507 start_codon:yes stop_codon:yes gene_type:complete